MKRILFLGILIFIFLMSFSQGLNYQRVKLKYTENIIQQVSKLGLNIDFVKPGKYIILEISKEELQLIQREGIEYEVLISDMEKFYRQRNLGQNPEQVLNEYRKNKNRTVPENFSLGSMGGFCTYDELLAQLDTMFVKFPNLITQRDTLPGQTIEGRPVYWLKISDNPNIDEDEPEVFYNAMIHAREPGSMQQLLYYMYYLLENYEIDEEIRNLVNNTEMYFVPCINPDGYLYNELTAPEGGGMWRKNRRINYNNTVGVDLNRNFGYMWGYNLYGSSTNPNSNTYRGAFAFSEPETVIIKNFAENHDFKITLNGHSYGNLLLCPWGYQSSPNVPDYALCRKVSTLLTARNQYGFGSTSRTLYLVNGDATDWFYGEQSTKPKSIAFTAEVGDEEDGFWPSVEQILPLCEAALEMNLMAAKLAGSYVEILDVAQANIIDISGFLPFGIVSVGQTDVPVKISIQPLGDSFKSVGEYKTFDTLPLLETVVDSIPFLLRPGLKPGDKIRYVVTAQNEFFEIHDTITRIYGSAIALLFDSLNTMENWSSEDWSLRSDHYRSPSASVSNVAGSYYPNSSQSSITFANPIPNGDSQDFWVTFYAYWDLDGGHDFMKFVVSTDDGQTWQNIGGRYSTVFYNGQQKMPVYEGYSTGWVKESILIEDVTGSSLLLGFRFESDEIVGRAGFFFDDFKVMTANKQTSLHEVTIQPGWSGISSWLIPENADISQVFGSNLSNVEFLQDESNFFQSQNQNANLDEWDSQSGYLIKSSAAFTIGVNGYPEKCRYLTLHQGWNLIPVFVNEAIPVENLSTDPPGMIVLIKNACGVQVFWPQENVQTLDALQPGNSYYIKLSDDAVLQLE